MTHEELEGNKLIAIYMGASITNIPGIQKPILYPVNGGNSIFLTRLKYHKSMDWLYPVYQKICNMMDSVTYETLDPYSKMLLEDKLDKIQNGLIDVDEVKTLFNKIVEWIKIYNEKVLENEK